MRANFDRLVPPPRALPTGLVLNTLFGAVPAVVGWALLLFLTPFVWLMLANADLTSPFLFRGALVHASGVVKAVADTQSRENRSDIYKVTYEFAPEGGAPRQAVSYVRSGRPGVGDAADVEYPAGRPDVSRIVGGRRALFGPGVLMILIFVAVALAFLYFSFNSGLRDWTLLRDGMLAKARFLGMSETNMRVNNKPVMALRYSFTGPDGVAREVSHNATHTAELTDDAHELLLYVPERPEVSRLVDALPETLTVDERGELASSGWGYRVALALAVLALVSHAGCAFLRFRS